MRVCNYACIYIDLSAFWALKVFLHNALSSFIIVTRTYQDQVYLSMPQTWNILLGFKKNKWCKFGKLMSPFLGALSWHPFLSNKRFPLFILRNTSKERHFILMKMFFFRRYEAKLRTIIFFNNLEKKKKFSGLKFFFPNCRGWKKMEIVNLQTTSFYFS